MLESARGTAGFVTSGFIPRFSIIPISLDLSKNQIGKIPVRFISVKISKTTNWLYKPDRSKPKCIVV